MHLRRASSHESYSTILPIVFHVYPRPSLDAILDTRKNERKKKKEKCSDTREFLTRQRPPLSVVPVRRRGTKQQLESSSARFSILLSAAVGEITRASAATWSADRQRDRRWRDNSRFVTSHSPALRERHTARSRGTESENTWSVMPAHARSICLRSGDRRRRRRWNGSPCRTNEPWKNASHSWNYDPGALFEASSTLVRVFASLWTIECLISDIGKGEDSRLIERDGFPEENEERSKFPRNCVLETNFCLLACVS